MPKDHYRQRVLCLFCKTVGKRQNNTPLFSGKVGIILFRSNIVALLAARRFGCSPDDIDRQLDASENENKVHCPYLSRERDKLEAQIKTRKSQL